MKKLAVGIDIGGTNTEIGFVDSEANILTRGSIPTQKYEEFPDYAEAVIAEIKRLQKELNEKEPFELIGIGIGAPNANYFNGTIDNAANLKWKGVVRVVDTFKASFPDTIVTMTNDANGAAIGEMIYGGAKGMSDFISITLGTGVGSGIVVGGDILYGHDSFAGEVGHIIIERNGRQCGCGRKGCLETYTSARGVTRTAFEVMAEMTDPSVLRNYNYEELDSKIVFDAAKAGDKLALEVFERTGERLGFALANVVAVTSPQAFFLFGGLSKAGDLILEPTKRYFNEHLLGAYKNKIDILMSELHEGNATVLGSSSLIWLEYNNKNK